MSSDAVQVKSVTLSAAQVIFTNVEVEYSPTGHRGFQTVFFTEEKINKEVLQSEIEPSLQYFPRRDFGVKDSPPEFVFFSLSSEQIAVGRITPLLDQVDKFGRKKMIFAHMLVFDAAEFRDRLDNNPFAVFDADPFYRSYEQVLESENVHPGRFNIASRMVNIEVRKLLFRADCMPPYLRSGENLKKLILMASAASNSKRKSYVLEVHGSPEKFLDVMRSLLAVMPPSLRSACSFDTCFVGDTGQAKSSRSTFWANGVGTKQRLQQDSVIRVDLDRQDSELSQAATDIQTPFEHWLASRSEMKLQTLTSESTQQQFHFINVLQDLLWGRRNAPGDFGATEQKLFEEFFAANTRYIAQLLRKNFSRFPGEAVADDLVERTLQWIKATGPTALSCVPRRFSSAQLCERLVPRYQQSSGASPKPVELEAIQRCAFTDVPPTDVSEAERLLRAFYLYWVKNWESFQELLALADCQEFSRIAAWVIRATGLKAEAKVFPLTKLAWFLGFVGKGYTEENRNLLKSLLFVPLAAKQKAPVPIAGKSFCRREVLRILTSDSFQSKKNYVESAVTHTSVQPQFRKVGVGYTTTDQTPFRPEQLHFLRKDNGETIPSPVQSAPFDTKIRNCVKIIEDAFASNNEQIVGLPLRATGFLQSATGFRLLEQKRQDLDTFVIATELSHFEFQRVHGNPFACPSLQMRPPVPEFLRSLKASQWFRTVRTMIKFLSRRTPFWITGNYPVLLEVFYSLFEILPEQLRYRCSFSLGVDPPGDAYINRLQITGAEVFAGKEAPHFDLSARKIPQEPEANREFVFERCLDKLADHERFDSVWASEPRILQQLYDLSELLHGPPSNFPATTTFSEPVLRLFADLNHVEIENRLEHSLCQQLGDIVGRKILDRAKQYVSMQCAEIPTILRTGFTHEWLINATSDWLSHDERGNLSDDERTDLAYFMDQIKPNTSPDAMKFKALCNILFGETSRLAAIMQLFEDKHFDEAFGVVCRKAMTRLGELGRSTREFSVIFEQDGDTLVGITLDVPDISLEASCNQVLAFRLMAAVFGCVAEVQESDAGYTKRKPDRSWQLTRQNDKSGRLWPMIIECLEEGGRP